MTALLWVLGACGSGTGGGGEDKTSPYFADGDADKEGSQSLTLAMTSGGGYRLTVHFDEKIAGLAVGSSVYDNYIVVEQEGTDGGFSRLEGAITSITTSSETVGGVERGRLELIVVKDVLMVGETYRVKILQGSFVSDEAGNELRASMVLGLTTSEIVVVDTKAPTLVSGGDALRIDTTLKTFTVSFSEGVKNKVGVMDLKPFVSILDENDAEAIADGKIKTVAVVGGKLVITLKDGETIADGDYKVKIEDNALTDEANNSFVGALTEADEVTTGTSDTKAPTLASGGDALRIDTTLKTLTVSFSEEMTLVNGSVVEVKKDGSPLVAGDIESVSLSSDEMQLVVTLNNPLENGMYQVVIGEGGLTDKVGNALAFTDDVNKKTETETDVLADSVLEGGESGDSYDFDLSSGGHNVIRDAGGVDRLSVSVGKDFDVTKMKLAREGEHFKISYEEASITVENWSGEGRIETLVVRQEGSDPVVYDLSSYEVKAIPSLPPEIASLHGDDTDNTLHTTERGGAYVGGNGGNDIIHGDAGNDRLYGDEGDDDVFGGEGDDVLDGGMGDDDLYGYGGNDTLYGGSGGDYLVGGEGDDVLEGGADDDRYYFKFKEGGDDILRDTGGTDGIILSLIGETIERDKIEIFREGDDLKITYGYKGEGRSVTVKDWSESGNRVETLRLQGSNLDPFYVYTIGGEDFSTTRVKVSTLTPTSSSESSYEEEGLLGIVFNFEI